MTGWWLISALGVHALVFVMGLILLALALPAAAQLPTDPTARAKVVGNPTSLRVQPESIQLTGPRATTAWSLRTSPRAIGI